MLLSPDMVEWINEPTDELEKFWEKAGIFGDLMMPGLRNGAPDHVKAEYEELVKARVKKTIENIEFYDYLYAICTDKNRSEEERNAAHAAYCKAMDNKAYFLDNAPDHIRNLIHQYALSFEVVTA